MTERDEAMEQAKIADEYDLDPLGEFAELRALIRRNAIEECALVAERFIRLNIRAIDIERALGNAIRALSPTPPERKT